MSPAAAVAAVGAPLSKGGIRQHGGFKDGELFRGCGVGQANRINAVELSLVGIVRVNVPAVIV